jgi:hypothetical protein
MIRRSKDFWRRAIEQQRASGLNATKFCKKRSLNRGTFLRWRKRLANSGDNQDFVEVAATTLANMPLSVKQSLEVRIGQDVRISVRPDSDFDLVVRFIAAVRRAS